MVVGSIPIRSDSFNTFFLYVSSYVRPDGRFENPYLDLDSLPLRTAALWYNSNIATLVDELHEILRGLPMEMPRGSQDIYGLDTSTHGQAMTFNGEMGLPRVVCTGEVRFKRTPKTDVPAGG
jgi:hypothetical protein